MNPVIESLLEIADQDPLPVAHTSSHWQHHGGETIVQRQGDQLLLRSSGFTAHSKTGLLGKLLYGLERLSYTTVTNRLRSYPSVWHEAKKLARDLRVDLTRHEWSNAVVLAFIVDHLNDFNLSPKTFALIGDGEGFFGALLYRYFRQSKIRIYSIDLPRILVFQACTYEKSDPRITLAVLPSNSQSGATEVTFVHPNHIEQIPGEIDCAVNVVSMQEMNSFSIESYFTFLRQRSTSRSRFYCVNRLRKEMPKGEISDFFEYPWRTDDQVFIDGSCPYFTHFFEWHTYPEGPRFLGIRVPLLNYFSGPSWHRLVRLAPLP